MAGDLKEQHENFAALLDKPDFTGWQPYIETFGFKIFRRTRAKSELYEYLAHGVLPDVHPETCHRIFTDYDLRKSWDEYIFNHRYISGTHGDGHMYCAVKYPWPLTNRDYVYMLHSHSIERPTSEHKILSVIGRSKEHTEAPESKSFVRVVDYEQVLAMRKHEKGTEILMHYFDDPRGSIPTFVINWAAQTGVPNFLKKFHQVCLDHQKKTAGK